MTIDWNTSALIATVLATAITLGVMVRSNIRRFAQMELKVDIIWQYLLERGLSSMITKGLATMNSPILIADEAVAWFNDLKPDLQRLYKEKSKWSDGQLAFEIQKRFSTRLLKEVCIPNSITNDEAIAIAVAIAKDQ